MDFKEIDEPGQLKKRSHFLMDMDQFHLATPLSDDAVTPRQFAQTIAIDELHAGQIDQKLFAAFAGEDVHQVAQLSAAIVQREPSRDVDNHDPIEFSGRDLKAHRRCSSLFLRGSYASENLLSSQIAVDRRRVYRSPKFKTGGLSGAGAIRWEYGGRIFRSRGRR